MNRFSLLFLSLIFATAHFSLLSMSREVYNTLAFIVHQSSCNSSLYAPPAEPSQTQLPLLPKSPAIMHLADDLAFAGAAAETVAFHRAAPITKPKHSLLKEFIKRKSNTTA